MANLVIVESPSKANTIKSYLGSGYKVIASQGHIRDLPKSSIGIDIDNGFAPHYINIRGKGDIIRELKKEAKAASRIYLATDPDREGEAISWHIAEELGIPKDTPCRVTFNEITKTAVKEAIKHPRAINEDLVNSQQARRILDRLVGFKLSPLLWKHVKGGLSGGRVQSVATRLIADREAEIRAFVPREYWTVSAVLHDPAGEKLEAKFYGNRKGKMKIPDEKTANMICDAVRNGQFTVLSVKHQQRQKLPAPPFTTSTLQQEAAKKLGFQTQRTMKVAQELYDGINLGAELGGFHGLITYMRTDSLRIASSAQDAARQFIVDNYGAECAPKNIRHYKSNANAQDAHEAIRPSELTLEPKTVRKFLSGEQYRLYKLIWERFIASQMAAAVLDTVSADIENAGYVFRIAGYAVVFRGYTAIYDNSDEDTTDAESYARLPVLEVDQVLASADILGEQHFTEPPARFTEASLVKFFEENGIGRPSTYAQIISIILSRNYVKRDGKCLVATPLGEVTTQFMRDHFPDIIDYDFTAEMEDKLDSIENKTNSLNSVLTDFYADFEKNVEKANNADSPKEIVIPAEESDVICEKCGSRMIYKNGRFGKFLACPNYPACRNTKAIDKNGNPVVKEEAKVELAGFTCELCGADMVVRRGKFGTFYACSHYPTCTFTKQKVTALGVPCPKCGGDIVPRHGKGKMLFYSCVKYPTCDFSSWDMPLAENCPKCGSLLYYRKSKKTVICKEKKCDYKREDTIPEKD